MNLYDNMGTMHNEIGDSHIILNRHFKKFLWWNFEYFELSR